MTEKDIFDAQYSSEYATGANPKTSEVKKFLKELKGLEKETKYGTSKPIRVVIRGKVIAR